MTPEHYDAIVIGTGQGGDPLARAWGKAGRRVAIIERGEIGGTCINTGCTPTKTMAASARVAYLARRAGDYGVHAEVTGVDLSQVRARKRAIVESFRGGTEKHLTDTQGVTLIRGEARFTGPKTVEVTHEGGTPRTLTAEQIFINTGARPLVPFIAGLDTVPFLDSAGIEELDEVPVHLLILGGGYIALEFGQMFRRFGSEVTVIEQSSHLLGHEDEDVAEEMAKILREDGLTIHLSSKATQVVRKADGSVQLTIATPNGTQTLSGSHLLVATGRVPNTDRLGLQEAGITPDDTGHVKANERLETNVPGVWVIGDVKGGPQFTHISYDDFRILEANLLHGGHRTTADRPVPYTVFTDPQLGRVGLTERESRAQGRQIKVAKIPMSDVARAIETDETRGFMKAIVDAKTDQILGCAILGVDGGEVMAVLEVAMLGKLPYTVIRDGVFAHPTLAESLNNLFMALDNG